MTYKQRLLKCYNCGTRWRDGLQYQNRGLARPPVSFGLPAGLASLPGTLQTLLGCLRRGHSILEHMGPRWTTWLSPEGIKSLNHPRSLCLSGHSHFFCFPDLKVLIPFVPGSVQSGIYPKEVVREQRRGWRESAADWYLGVLAAAPTRPAFKSWLRSLPRTSQLVHSLKSPSTFCSSINTEKLIVYSF